MNSHSAVDITQSQALGLDEVVRLADVRRRFNQTVALDGISLTVRKGEILGIIGRSGAGKSTLIRCLNGLERPDSGEIIIEGTRIDHLAERQLQPLRRRIGMIFQHFNLLSSKTVEANVALPLKIEGSPKAERLARARELLDLVGLSDKAKAYPAQLSGGQKQRVGIARALAARPALLLSDEATSALDPETTRSILALLKEINRKLGLTIVLITHEMDVVRTIADRVAVINAGQIVEEGDVRSVFAAPRQEITKSLLSGNRPHLPEHLQSRLGSSGNSIVASIDLLGPYGQQQFFADLSETLAHGGSLVQGALDHIQGEPVARFFITIPAEQQAVVERLRAKLDAAGAHLEVLGHV
ncbi:D-methionine transport system ATP-binding protein [Neorhizobium galegae]|uniref:methionine ABC transporter ATP-binding protein n=1 Tax=Neorhizobium galegae TaxID=399 RepID=UPI001FD8F077|nr:methionine ABC transporter ATP-binding protein [Neorhizobium galegae]MBP2551191.1 D-methionine transport system ATP-binding protein [Neorhizobium galegae]